MRDDDPRRLPASLPGRQQELDLFSARPAPLDGYAAGYAGYAPAGRWRETLGVIRRLRWIVVAVALAGAAFGQWRASKEVPVYEAMAVLRVSKGSAPGQGGGAAGLGVLAGGGTDLLTELELLRSRTMAGIVADSLRLTVQGPRPVREVVTTAELLRGASSVPVRLSFGEDGYSTTDAGLTPYGTAAHSGDAVVVVAGRPVGVDSATIEVVSSDAAADQVRGALNARVRGATQIVEISYRSTDARFAADVVNTTARVYQEQAQVGARRSARAQRDFLAAQLARADSAFVADRSQLESFQGSNGQLPSTDRLSQWSQVTLDLQSKHEGLVRNRAVVSDILSRVGNGPISDSDLQALVYAPVISENEMVRSLYGRYQQLREERENKTAGPFGRAQTSPEIQGIDANIERTRREIVAAAQNLLRILDQQISVAARDLADTQNRVGDLPRDAERETDLLQKVASSRAVADEMRGEMLRAQIAEALEVGNVDIVDLARVPGSPLQHRGLPKWMIGLLLGTLAGGLVAIGFDRLNNTIRSREEVEAALQVPSLAVIPRTGNGDRYGIQRLLPAPKAETKTRRVVVAEPSENGSAIIVEAYKTLRTNLMFSRIAHDIRVLSVTSAMPAEGKTTTAANLATAFAQQGVKTLLVDADLRRPRLHELFGTPVRPGLTDMLIGSNTVPRPAQTGITNLYLLPGGQVINNPSEVLGSLRFKDFLEQVSKMFELVILDTPPVLPFTDAAVLATMTDGVLVVVSAGATDRRLSQAAVSQLRSVGARVVGSVLNRFDERDGTAQGVYYDAYGYYSGSSRADQSG